ncbi:alpha/beta fold hydrolase [Cupriavidus sp. CuC1]|uniref:alpha/beta fold hydrolase n=1 Tax=Cupriavidus sp. CuC1 TaxID=3373131 RepID=UPI0037D1A029
MNRRKLLTVAANVPLVAATLKPRQARAADGRDFVLVHGAFHGGWCWGPVAEILRSHGNRVFTPTFTGVGERAHLMNPAIDLNTFIRDITAVIEWEELNNIVLVGHSFGGFVISGVADLMPDRIRSMVYLDAPMGSNGVSILGEAPPDLRKARMSAVIDVAGTQAIAPPSSTAFGLSDPAQVASVDRRLTPMPFKPYDTPLVLKGPPGGNLPKRFIRCTHPALPNIEPSARYAKEHGWKYAELPTGHDAMVSLPEEVAEMLLAS